MDKALCRAITPDQREPGAYGGRIFEQPLDEGTQLLHPGVLHLRDPGVKLVALAFTDHAAEGLDLVIRAGHDRIEAEETRQEGPIGRAPVLRFRQKQAGRSEGGQWGGAALVMVLRIEGRRRHLSEFEPGARLPPQLADVPRHRPPRRPVPLPHELPPELLGVATAGIPPPSQIRGERRDQGLPAMPWPLPLGRLGHREIPIDGRATDLDLPRDGGNPHVLGMQPLDLVIAADPAGVTRLADRRKSGRERWGSMP
jgi:hypothetical protein